jgi:hypothetical protein
MRGAGHFQSNYARRFGKWDELAGGPWPADETEMLALFHRTVTAGNWTRAPQE